MPTNPLHRLLKAGENTELRRYIKILHIIEEVGREIQHYSMEELHEETMKLRERLHEGEEYIDVLPEAFAVVRETSHRVLGKRHFDEQIIGGIALALGNIAEMKTGEGKSLTAALPAYLHSLSNKGVHIVTVNDYLATTQSVQIAQLLAPLGVSVGCITAEMNEEERQEQYRKDITYGTSTEFGFDYLRDNMAKTLNQQVQRGHHSIVVDEADSVLLDEARTPLIISGPSDVSENMYRETHKIALRLEEKTHYEVDHKARRITMTDEGYDEAEKLFNIHDMFTAENAYLIALLDNALQAKELYVKDKHYIIAPGEKNTEEIHLVDSHTGRVLGGRRYSDSLHQALEAKENVQIQAENKTMASITLQHYVKLYTHISGMTGTAYGNAAELSRSYGVQVIPVPTHRPVQRIEHPDKVYATEEKKFAAVIEDVKNHHHNGQPVLIGTASIHNSERISELLNQADVPHNLLNAKEAEREADIIAQAGTVGAVTVATNMAGRGTDIILGGNAEHYAESKVLVAGVDPVRHPVEHQQLYAEHYDDFVKKHAGDKEKVIAAGGLYVIGTERHTSRRIDDQLRGRAGRQGDVGETVFYTAPTDDILLEHRPDLAEKLSKNLLKTESKPESSAAKRRRKEILNAVNTVQANLENEYETQRSNAEKYDSIIAAQRNLVYQQRQQLLSSPCGDGEEILHLADRALHDAVNEMLLPVDSSKWKLKELYHQVRSFYPCTITPEQLRREYGESLLAEDVLREYSDDVAYTVSSRLEALGGSGSIEAESVERGAILRAIDTRWMEHIDVLLEVQQGIHLRSFSGRQPQLEFAQDASHFYQSMVREMAADAVCNFFGGPAALSAFGVAVDSGLISFDAEDDVEVDEGFTIDLPTTSRQARKRALEERKRQHRSLRISGIFNEE